MVIYMKEFSITSMSKKTYDRICVIQTYTIGVIIATVLLSAFVVMHVASGSMYPTFKTDTIIIVSRKDRIPDREDKMVFFPNSTVKDKNNNLLNDYLLLSKGERSFTKRCVGIPGDTIAVHDGRLIRNGEIVNEDYTNEDFMDYEMDEVTLGEDEYFMMGDNRNDSHDSHVFGPVHKDQFVGKIIFFY